MRANPALALVILSLSAASGADAQTAPATPLPIIATLRPSGGTVALPANTELFLTLNQELSSKRARTGDMFDMTVSHDVLIDNYVVIPKGALGKGEVTWRTGKGMFGKSAKMEIELRYVDVNGRRVPITGKYRQEGEGNTVATVGTVVLAGVFGALVTGKSARIPPGRELKANTTEMVPVALPQASPAPTATAQPAP
jgi:hypothetical protein